MSVNPRHVLARLRFRHLQLVAEVDRTGSLSGAAQALNLTQPALSKALKEIEDLLGCRIFERGRRGLVKTAQGAVVIDGASLLLRELQHVQLETESAGSQGDVSAVLRLGTSAYLAVGVIPPVIAALTALDPPIAVQLREGAVPTLFESLLGGELDALVCLYNSDVMAKAARREVRFEKIADEAYDVVAPNHHPVARMRKVTWETLAQHRWVFTRKPSLARVYIEDSFRRHGVQPPAPICETDGPLAALQMVGAGVGLAAVPRSTTTQAVRAKLLNVVRVDHPPPAATLGLVYRTATARHPRVISLRRALGLHA